VAVGGSASPAAEAGAVDLGAVAIMPGLVNAHTHLELSWMRGLVEPAPSFTVWVRAMMQRRVDPPAGHSKDAELGAIEGAIAELQASGTVLVGDVTNSLAPAPALAASRLGGVIFHELIKFNPSDPGEVDDIVRRATEALAAMSAGPRFRASLAPHAPYSVTPALFAAIKASLPAGSRTRTTVHVGESREEMELLATGGGPWRTLLATLKAWDPRWQAPGCGPIEYLDRLGFMDHRVLAVHGVQLDPGDLERLAASGATLVTCPRSNGFTGVGPPPVSAFYRSGVAVAVGTDSLASVPDLNLFGVLAALRSIAPGILAGRLIESATRVGARALGFEDEYGTIEPGKRAALITVEVPAGVVDVEEYLLSGIQPGQVQWVSTTS
jgi:cytosine/adenosine deaminase-related metal-dependent hydrolase